MRVDGIRDEAVAEACDALLESLDVLLERLANRVESAPAAGSAEWKNQWSARESADGRERLRRHLLVKIAIATAARVDPTHDIEMARQAGIPEADIARASGRKTQRRAPHGNAGLTPTQTTLW
ncbi:MULTISPECIES: hypothetical protein [Rhodococcus]|jgi:hypothetical protein|uniref:hypothetical protein n=1 Tax=Rhodococcus TaxID=1827 RepID=UPI0007BBD4A5|nr:MULTISPECIES: hypothetical protein [Rhodococcus]KZF15179.1 hypothetical protein A2J01_32180 [Rhodococcus sp. EPR-134]MDJ0440215.1 hypothetical protein [Rhodococcus qingshengii]